MLYPTVCVYVRIQLMLMVCVVCMSYCLLPVSARRELAFQIADQFQAFGKGMNVRDVVIVGGMGMPLSLACSILYLCKQYSSLCRHDEAKLVSSGAAACCHSNTRETSRPFKKHRHIFTEESKVSGEVTKHEKCHVICHMLSCDVMGCHVICVLDRSLMKQTDSWTHPSRPTSRWC